MRIDSFCVATCLLGGAFAPSGTVMAQDSVPARMVSVDGRAMRIRLSMPERREPGSPVVVLEAGGFGGVDSWGTLLTRIAAIAPVLAYDRRGLGQSEPDGEPPTPYHVAAVLHRLLETIGAAPPYVLVGHSWGGPLIRGFATRYPRETAGMVFLDATDCESSADDFRNVFLAAGGTEEGFQRRVEESRTATSRLPPGRRETAELFTRCQIGEAEDLLSSLRIPEVPVAVLIGAATGRRRIEAPAPVDGLALSAGLYGLRLRHQTGWAFASADGLLLVSSRAGHYLHRDDPELALYAVQHVLSRVRSAPGRRPQIRN